MRKNSKNSFQEIENFFAEPSTINQKAWGIIHNFYHEILTSMEKNKLNKAGLAKKLDKSRSAISQMFNKTPNITIKKMVEISDILGLDIKINVVGKEVLPAKLLFVGLDNTVTSSFPYQSISVRNQRAVGLEPTAIDELNSCSINESFSSAIGQSEEDIFYRKAVNY
ncbi:MAG: helix-turn-helix transcriptional regulator [Deltaproteobacteria bacterium]|nr:helix-turn-helix transcriptional regulator [Deltaproteobacteria bacterium]